MRSRRAMTLIELVCVVGMIAILAAILFPVFARSREAARKQSCLSNLVNIGLALQLYTEDHGERFPPADDDLSPLLSRHLRGEVVFRCPSSNRQDIPMGAPANPDLLPSPLPIKTNYYYRAGHRPSESPSAPIVTDQGSIHNEHANVLFTDNHVESLSEQPWRDLGFEPIDEILEPQPDEWAPGPMGMPGAPAPGGG